MCLKTELFQLYGQHCIWTCIITLYQEAKTICSKHDQAWSTFIGPLDTVDPNLQEPMSKAVSDMWAK